MTDTQKPTADAFDTFAAFFRAAVAWLKATGARFSYRWLAKRLELKSHTLLLRFAAGEQLPTPDLLARLGEVLRLTADELVYLRALVGAEGAKSGEEREVYQAKVDELRRPGVSRRRLEPDAFELIASWQHAAVLELAGQAGFSPEPVALAQRLRGDVSAEAVAGVLERLERAGLLARDAAGTLARTPDAVQTGNNIPSRAIRAFHAEMLGLAHAALDGVPIDRRFFFGQTLSIAAERLPEAERLIVEFRARFHKLLEGGRADQVYQLAVQFFPLTR